VTPHYREIRYEDLRADPTGGLASVLTWLGLEHDEAFVEDAVRACDLDRLRASADDESRPVPGGRSPAGFFGKGAVGGWEAILGRGGARRVETVCWDAMRATGYEPRLARSGDRTLRIRAHDALRRVRESVDWQLERLSFRL
jgi:hypothetical protein